MVFSEGDLVLVYDQDKDTLGTSKFKPMWYDYFIIKNILRKLHMSWLTLMETCCWSLEMGSILRSIMSSLLSSISFVF